MKAVETIEITICYRRSTRPKKTEHLVVILNLPKLKSQIMMGCNMRLCGFSLSTILNSEWIHSSHTSDPPSYWPRAVTAREKTRKYLFPR